MPKSAYGETAKKYEDAGYKNIAGVLRHLEFESARNPRVQLVVPFDSSIIPLPPADWVEEREGKQHLLFRLDWLMEFSAVVVPNDEDGFGLIDTIAQQALEGLAERSAHGRA